jgi:hypothetical protein
MNVGTDEFLKSLKSLQVSRCECSAKNPDSDYPTSTRKPAPDSRRCTAGARPATGPGQPHEITCVQFKRPVKGELKGTLKSGPFFGHGLKYAIPDPKPKQFKLSPPEKFVGSTVGSVVDPGHWTFGDMAAKIIADAVAAAESASGQGALNAAELLPETSVNFIDFGPIHPMQLSEKEKQALAYVQAHAMQLQAQVLDSQAKMYALAVDSVVKASVAPVAPVNFCTCAPGSAFGHAAFCPLGEDVDAEAL